VLEFIRTIWPIAVVLLPLVTGAGFLWLKTQFPTKQDLAAAETRLADKMDEHDDRLDTGSKTMANLDKRIALVEDECRQAPSRQNLQIELSTMAQRIRGVEVQAEAISSSLTTQNTYLHTLIENHMDRRR